MTRKIGYVALVGHTNGDGRKKIPKKSRMERVGCGTAFEGERLEDRKVMIRRSAELILDSARPFIIMARTVEGSTCIAVR